MSKKPAPKGGKDSGEPPKKKKELPKELCGCGVDTYRPPPKGKRAMAPIEHAHGCVYQRTTCEAYPLLPRCQACQSPCPHCLGKYRWCPHCYERQCTFRYKRPVIGWEPPAQPPGTRAFTEGDGSGRSKSVRRRTTTVQFSPGDDRKSSRSETKVR